MLYLKKLRTILQFNWFYYFLIIFLIIYIFLNTIVIRYETSNPNPDYLEGIITDINFNADNISFILKGGEKVRCVYYGNDINFADYLGKKVRVKGSIIPIYNNTIPNTFNYQKYLYNKRIYLNYNVKEIEILKDENLFFKIKKLIYQRIDGITKIDNLSKIYLNLFILGNKDYLSEDLKDIYRVNGIIHLFAISGMHISLFILLLNKILKNFKFKKGFIIAFLGFYSFLVNFTASVLRVVLFYSLKYLFENLQIDLDNQKILFLSLTIILLIEPFMIYDIGLLYSYSIAFALLFFKEKITGNYLQRIFKISFIALIVSLPIAINMNYGINFLSLFLNLLFVPLVSFIIFPLSIITFICSPLLPILKVFLNLLESLNIFFYNYRLTLLIPKMPIILIVLYYLVILIIVKYHKSKGILILTFIVFINVLIPKLDNNYYVYYLDVGQGDSSLLISPHKEEVIMIDTGGTFKDNYHVSKNTITFLKSLGINKIDLLIISHGDVDHAKETLYLLDKFRVNNIILNHNKDNNLEKKIRESGKVNDKYQSKYFSFQNINDYLSANENDSSIITYLKIYNYSFLFLGDISKSIEENLIKDYNLQGNFLKLAHHGSKTSSSEEFLKNFKINLAIISSGRNNMYNHPSKETIENLEKLNIKYLNTQTSGTILLKLRKNDYIVKEYKP